MIDDFLADLSVGIKRSVRHFDEETFAERTILLLVFHKLRTVDEDLSQVIL